MQRRTSKKGTYILRRYLPGTGKAIEQFERLERDIFSGKVTESNVDCRAVINAIIDYIRELNALPRESRERYHAERIRESPAITRRLKVVDYEPGTGRSTKQFYTFAKAIMQGRITADNTKCADLLLLIKTYFFDRIE